MGAAVSVNTQDVREVLGTGTVLQLNPRLDLKERVRVEGWVASPEAPPGLVWIRTSGSQGAPRLVGLSRRALRCSAKAVNAHLAVQPGDRWLLALPTFHVGGLGVLVRAALADLEVRSPFARRRWSAPRFLALARRTEASLSALVPTQVYDLVRLGEPCPATLRAIVVGGDALLPSLYAKARALGYPLVPSYGLSECASQVATASLRSLGTDTEPTLTILPHVQVQIGPDGGLHLRSEALLSGYLLEQDGAPCFVDPKVDGWLDTGDLGVVHGVGLVVNGRAADCVKIGGELVVIPPLNARLEVARQARCPAGDAVLIARPDPRLGHQLWLVVNHRITPHQADALRETHDVAALPFERCAGIISVKRIPRTALGKLRRGALERHLEQ